MGKSKINQKALEQAFNEIEISLPKVEINEGFKVAVMSSSLIESEHWKQFWALIKKIFENGEENFDNKYFVPIMTQFQANLFDEIYSDYQVFEKQKDAIKKDFFESKYFVFSTVNNTFRIKPTEIENYVTKLFFLPKVFLKTYESENKKMELIIENLQNKRRTFTIVLMKKIKEIEFKTKNNIPKPKQIECVILANRELKEFAENELIDENGYPTLLLISIRNAYKSQKKSL
jgi:hypothetical protein